MYSTRANKVIKLSIIILSSILVLVTIVIEPSTDSRWLKVKNSKALVDLESPITDIVRWSQRVFEPIFDVVSSIINTIDKVFYNMLRFLSVFEMRLNADKVFSVSILSLVLAVLIYFLITYKYAIATFFVFHVFLWLGYWDAMLRTFSLVLTAATLAMAIGFPLGVLMARNDRMEMIMKPVLDFMQSFPPYIYLVPAVVFFGLGAAPGVVATVLFAIPPPAKLTNLGIREVPGELVEAGKSFGCNWIQLLFRVEFPEAFPSILIGVNQCIMMSLGMVVIAALIGAGGLGAQVIIGIQRLWIGKGVVSGLLIVLLAVWIDRVTQSFKKN
jgi:glycine betaine/proline transport system permease protein